MILHDRIYGTHQITDPLIVKLIKSKPVQRLKHIAQYGIPDDYYFKKNYSRFEHSIGVFLLLRKFNAPRNEQIAGLLHDVSHTAFSHVIDWVIGNRQQENYQDKQHETILLHSDIPAILESEHINIAEITDYKQYPLLEQPMPDLCADRIDYALREFPAKNTSRFVSDLTVYANQFCFKTKKTALLFSQEYLNLQVHHWGGFEGVSLWKLFSDALSIALEKNIVKLSDFNTTDKYVLSKLNKSSDPDIKRILIVLQNKSLGGFKKSKNYYHKKFRYIDPQIPECQNKRLSEIDKSFSKKLEMARIQNNQGIQVAIL